MTDEIQFATNIPQTVALKSTNPKAFPSKFEGGATRYMFRTTDDRVMFLPEHAANRILDDLQLGVGEEFTICMREVRQAGQKPRVEWTIERSGGVISKPLPPTESAQSIQTPRISSDIPSSLQRTSNPPVKMPLDRALSMFLLMAGRSTRDAERVLGAEGGSVRFDSRDVAALATTMFIESAKSGYLGWITPETAQRYTAELKIDQLTQTAAAPEAAPKPQTTAAAPEIPGMWRNRPERRAVFEKFRELVGETAYHAVLNEARVRTPDEFRSNHAAIEAYDRLVAIARQQEAA